MEVEMNMELEIAEVRPRVYDILHPTPVPLAQLSAIVTSFEVWCYEMNKYRTRNELREFWSTWRYEIELKTILPDIPSVINDLVQEYIGKLQCSLGNWFKDHHETVFRFNNNYSNNSCFLNDFDDFVTDFKGDIDYVRTAERMMLCDRLDDTVKFRTACKYCLEDDIRRIWPSVCEIMTSRAAHISYDFLQLRYWFGILTNQLDKMNVFKGDLATTCELLFELCAKINNRSAMEYFWNRIRPDNRLEKASDLLDNDDKCLARFILLKLDDQQLGEFVDEYGGLLMSELLSGDIDADDGIVIIPTWMYIRNLMNEKQFLDLSKCMFELLASHDADNNELFFCREIWNSAPHNLKQSAVTKILSSTGFLNMLVSSLENDGMESTPKLVKFLLNILPSATFDERSSFWINCWHRLVAVARCKYLQQFMKLCFRNEDEIAEFKANVMADSEHLSQSCNSLVKATNFKKLNDLLKFYYPEVQQARNRKQELLQLVLLGEDCQFSSDIVQYTYRLNKFINETYDCADLSAEFKNQLVMSPAFEKFVSLGVRSTDIYDLIDIKKFVDQIQLTEQTLVQIKTRIIDSFKESLTGDGSSRDLLKERSLHYFLSWCLGSDAEVHEFRRNNALL